MKITFSGDICVKSEINNFSIENKIRCIYNQSDYNVACLEAPICKNAHNAFRKIGPSLKQCSSIINSVLSPFSHVSLANNHSMDYGTEGLEDTIKQLDELGIKSIGAGFSYPEMYKPEILETDEIRVALFCWAEAQYGCVKNSEHQCGYAWILNPLTYRLIQQYKKICDYVVLFLHAGLEDVEYPILDWREQYRTFIDYGADLIIANHPHVIQGKEKYKGKNIYYSLGNYFFNDLHTFDNIINTNSLIVECDFSPTGIQTREYFASFNIDTVRCAEPHIRERFLALNETLKPESFKDYLTIHNQMLIQCWDDYYKSSYSWPIWKKKEKVIFYKRWFNSIMKGYAQRCFLPPITENHLYHNINIDTHRFVVSRVCALNANTY